VEDLTAEVLRRLDSTPDPRLREIMQALVRHLHAFTREVALTDEEWLAGVKFLTATGQMCDDKRQEFILLSDTLGLSMLVDEINHGGGEAATESTVLGPFYVAGAPLREYGESIVLADDSTRAVVSGVIRGTDGKPIPGALLDVWQTASNGLYDVQDPSQPPYNLRGRFHARDDGSYRFITVKPAVYPIPDDGPVGGLLRATDRHPWRAAHIHVIVSADGYRPVTTHIFPADSGYLDSDAVFGVKDSLIRSFARHDDPAEAARLGVPTPYFTVDYDFVLSPS
jgi:protocatechuate 3,4-dioxygenase beta subunit